MEMAPVARVRLLLDSVPGGQNQQAFCQGPSGDSVSFAGHGVSTPRLSSGHALGQRSEQQVTWGHQTSQGWCCAVPPTARPPDKRRPRACHCCRRIQPSNQSSRGAGFTTISHPVSHGACPGPASSAVYAAGLLGMGSPAQPPGRLPGKDTSPVLLKPLAHYPGTSLGDSISGDSEPGGGAMLLVTCPARKPSKCPPWPRAWPGG